MPCQARSITSWATSSASLRSPSSRSSSMNTRSAYALDSCSKAATSPAWARAISLASVAAESPAAGSEARLPGGGGTRASEPAAGDSRPEEHTSELQSHLNLVWRLLLEKKKEHDSHRHDVSA